jgi:periplasmic iron binding protein
VFRACGHPESAANHKLMIPRLFRLFTGVAALAAASSAPALEYPIGKPQIRDGMEVATVYLQPVTMEPAGMMRDAKASDIHLEADIKATDKNGNGFADGTWIPYLAIAYELSKQGSNERITGTMMPMVASDGPHYGDNVKLAGPGRYKLKLSIAPPGSDPHSHFGRHVDKETGVGAWFKPFTVEYDFAFAGVGKKGGY